MNIHICEKCHTSYIRKLAWVEPNNKNKFIEYWDDENNSFCNECYCTTSKSVELKLVCENCGCHNVEVKAWVNANTNEYCSDAENEKAWCPDCNEHVYACNIDVYLEKNKRR